MLRRIVLTLVFTVGLAHSQAQAMTEIGAWGLCIGGGVVSALGIVATVFGFADVPNKGTYSCSQPICTNSTSSPLINASFCCYKPVTTSNEPLSCVGYPVPSPTCPQIAGDSVFVACPDCQRQPNSLARYDEAAWVLPMKIVGPIAIVLGLVPTAVFLFGNINFASSLDWAFGSRGSNLFSCCCA